MTSLTGALAPNPWHPGGRSVVPRGSATRLVAVAALVALASVALALLVPPGGSVRLAARPVAGSRPVESSPEHPARVELGVRPPGLLAGGGVDRRHAPVARGLLAVLFVGVGAIAAGSIAVGGALAVAPVRPRSGRPSSRGPPAS